MIYFELLLFFRFSDTSVVPDVVGYAHKKRGTFRYSHFEVFGVTRSDRITKVPRVMHEHFAKFPSELKSRQTFEMIEFKLKRFSVFKIYVSMLVMFHRHSVFWSSQMYKEILIIFQKSRKNELSALFTYLCLSIWKGLCVVLMDIDCFVKGKLFCNFVVWYHCCPEKFLP